MRIPWMNEYHIVVDFVRAKELRLYRSRRVLDQWEYLGVLLSGLARL